MVTLSKQISLAALVGVSLGLFAPKFAQADSVSDLFNTGVDGSGNVLPDMTSPDPHYTVVSGGDGSVAAPVVVHPSNPTPPYVGPNTTSAWLEPTTTNTAYDYQTTFTLPAGATNLAITGEVAVDNTLIGVLINGFNVGTYASGASLTNLTSSGSAAFTGFNNVAFTIPDADLLTGTNTLTFITGNQSFTSSGFRVDALAGTYTPSSSAPEPMSLSLFGFGAATLLVRRRKA